jgi:phosphoglycolate phosphatase-like HAD superfamily hydrolase
VRIALDFDGTLVTCHAKQMGLLRAVCSAHGVALAADAVWHLKRSGLDTVRALVTTGVSPDVAAEVARLWQAEIESPFWCQFDSLFPDVLVSLQHAIHRGGLLLLLTSRRRPDLLNQQIDRLQIRHFFDSVVVVNPAHARNMKATALKEWSADAFIGDSESDLEAASIAAVPFVGVTTGQRTSESLGARTIAKSLGAAMRMVTAQ